MKQQHNRHRAIFGWITVVLVSVHLLAGISAAAPVEWTNKGDDNRWHNARNWDSGSVPKGKQIHIQKDGDDRAVLNKPASIKWLRVNHNGELEINADLTSSAFSHSSVGRRGGIGKINHNAGYYKTNVSRQRAYKVGTAPSGTGTRGIYNLKGGTLEVRDVLALGKFGKGGVGLMNITGGSLRTWGKVRINKHSTFHISGSAPDEITVGYGHKQHNRAPSGSGWRQQGTLELRIDKNGISPIVIKKTNGKGGDVTFEPHAKLDVGFLNKPRIGRWDVMSWEGTLNDKGLSFAGNVDTDVWNFEFVDTDGSEGADTLRISAVPAPFFDQKKLVKAAVIAQDDAVALESVGKLTNEKALYWLAQNAEDAGIRFSAVSKLTNTQALANIVKGDDNKRIRYVAAQRIPDEERPAGLNIEFDPSSIDSDRLWKITDASRLTEIALNSDESKEKRLQAIWALTDQQKLFDIAIQARNYDIRLAAAKKITDRNMLSLDHKEPAIRHRMALEISDQDRLKQIVKNDSHDAVRAAATRRVTDKTFLKRVVTSNLPISVRVAAVRGLESPFAEMVFKRESDKLRQAVLQKFGRNVELGHGPAELDADEPYVRFKKHRSYIDLTLDCDPDKQNYFTVKVWGGSGSGNGKYGSKLIMHTNRGSKMVTWQRKGDPLPGRFYYGTVPIPLEATEGKSSVEIRLTHNKGRGEPGPDVYGVYTHLGGFYQPPEDELQGEPFELGPPRPPVDNEISREEAYEHWTSEANLGFRKARKYQIFGDKYQELIEEGEVPAWTYGAVLARSPGATEPNDTYKQLDTEIERWGGWLIHQGRGNMRGAFAVLKVYAMAYTNEWSDFYQDEEMLHRVAAAMDFYSKAQGSGGLFRGPELPGDKYPGAPFSGWETWIGGPDREGFQGRIFSAGQGPLYRAYKTLYPHMEDRGFLNKKIDHDLNPKTPKITRREAYAKMMERSWLFLEKKAMGRSVANQNFINYRPLGSLYNAMKITAPEKAKKRQEQMREMAKVIAGIRKTPDDNEYLVSPKGLTNEAGAYAGSGYGAHNPRRLTAIAQRTGFPEIIKRLPDAYEAYSHFLYLGNDEDGYRKLNRTEWIGKRSRRGFPGRELYFTNFYAANELEIPVVIRHHELYEKHNRDRGNKLWSVEYAMENRGGKGGQLPHITRSVVGKANRARRAMEGLPSTDYRLPAEREEDTVFVDEYFSCAAIRHGDATMFVRFINKSDIAILRYMTPEFDRLAQVKYDSSGPKMPGGPHVSGSTVKALRYGPYFIVLNGSEEETLEYEVPKDIRGARVPELKSGRLMKLGSTIELSPMSSQVLNLDPTHVQLSLDWRGYVVAGEKTTIRAELENIRSRTLQDVGGTLAVPDGWETTVQRVEGLGENDTLAGNQTATVVWTVRPPEDATIEDYSISTTAEFDPGEDWGGTTSTTAEDHVEWTGTVRPDPDPNALLVAGTQADLEFTLQPGFPIRDMSLVPSDDTQGWDIQPAGDNPDSIEPGTEATLSWTVTPPADAEGEHSLSLSYVRGTDGQTVRDEPPLTATVVGAGENIAPFGSPFASSTHGRHSLHNMINGETSGNWGSANGWNDATRGEFPDWVGVEFDNPVPIDRVDVWTRHGNEKLSDFDIQVFRDGEFQTVASVDDNTDKHVVSRFDEVTTDKVRVFVQDAPGYSRVLELQVFNEAAE